MADDPIGSAAKRSLRTSSSIMGVLDAWVSNAQPFPYDVFRDGVQLVRDARVRASQTTDDARRAGIVDASGDLAVYLSKFSQPFASYAKIRWGGFIQQAITMISIPRSLWAAWWRELTEHREVIDSDILLEDVFTEISLAWVDSSDELEVVGRLKVAT